MGPERRIVENVNGWLPLKAVLPMSRGGVRLLAGPLTPVDVFEVLAGPEFFWDGADGALPPPWDGIFTDDLYCLVVGGGGGICGLWGSGGPWMRIAGFWPVATCRGARTGPGFSEPWWRSSRYSRWGRSAICACDSLMDASWRSSAEIPSPRGDWRGTPRNCRPRTTCRGNPQEVRSGPEP